MILIHFLIVLLTAPAALAAPQSIVVDSKLIYEGKRLSSPRITTLVGSKAVVSQRDKDGSTQFSLELRPLMSKNDVVKMQYSLLLKEAKNEIHSRGTLKLTGKQKGLIFLDKGKVQIQLQVNRS